MLLLLFVVVVAVSFVVDVLSLSLVVYLWLHQWLRLLYCRLLASRSLSPSVTSHGTYCVKCACFMQVIMLRGECDSTATAFTIMKQHRPLVGIRSQQQVVLERAEALLHRRTRTRERYIAYMRSYLHTSIQTYIMHSCVHTGIHTYDTYIHIHTCIHTYLHIQLHSDTYMHTYRYTYIDIYLCIHAFIHTCT